MRKLLKVLRRPLTLNDLAQGVRGAGVEPRKPGAGHQQHERQYSRPFSGSSIACWRDHLARWLLSVSSSLRRRDLDRLAHLTGGEREVDAAARRCRLSRCRRRVVKAFRGRRGGADAHRRTQCRWRPSWRRALPVSAGERDGGAITTAPLGWRSRRTRSRTARTRTGRRDREAQGRAVHDWRPSWFLPGYLDR
jgi:hypothetical protein